MAEDNEEQAVDTGEERADKDADAEEEEATGSDAVRASVTREGACECTIRIESDADELKQRYDETLATLQQQTALPGFRTGKAPTSLVAKRLASRLRVDVLSSVLGEGYEKAVKDNDLTVVAETEAPDVEQVEWEVGEPVDFTVKCEVLPAIDITEEQYKGVRAQVPKFELTGELVQEEMEGFARQLSRWDKLEGGSVQEKDFVKVQVTVPGESEEAAWTGELDFYAGTDRMGPFQVEGLKEAATGLSAGESVELQGTLGEELGPETDEGLKAMAGQTVALRAEVIEMSRLNVPEIDDELAKKLGMEDAGQVREIVRERLERRLAGEKKEAVERAVMDAILDRVPMEMPASLVERATVDEQKRLISRAIMQGIGMEQAQHVAAENVDRFREAALRNLKRSYVLRKVAERERVFVLDGEVKEQVRALAAREGWSEQRTEHYMKENDLESSLRDEMRSEKTMTFIIENAELEEAAPEELAAGEPDETTTTEQ